MIVELGTLGILRNPLDRRPPPPAEPGLPEPESEFGPPYLPSAQMMADMVGQFLESGYGLSNHQAAGSANGKIDPEQRFYEIDYRQAAHILAGWYPIASEDVWVIHLKNNMGWRLVPVAVCRYGYVVDPVTRQCVAERVKPKPPADAKGAPPAVKDNGKNGNGPAIPTWGYAVGVGLLVFLLAQPS